MVNYSNIEKIEINGKVYKLDNPNQKPNSKKREGRTCYVVQGESEDGSTILVKLLKNKDNYEERKARLKASYDNCNDIISKTDNKNYFVEWKEYAAGEIYYTEVRSVATFNEIITEENLVAYEGEDLFVNAYNKVITYFYGVLRVLKQLEAIHEAGYVHCDIKSDNILMVNDKLDKSHGLDNVGFIRIIDFDASIFEEDEDAIKEGVVYSTCTNTEIKDRKVQQIEDAECFADYIHFDLYCIADLLDVGYGIFNSRYKQISESRGGAFDLRTEMILNELKNIAECAKESSKKTEDLIKTVDKAISYFESREYKNEKTYYQDILFNVSKYIHEEKCRGDNATTYDIYRGIDEDILPAVKFCGKQYCNDKNNSALHQIVFNNNRKFKILYLGEGGLGKSTALIKFFVEQNRRAISGGAHPCLLFACSEGEIKNQLKDKYRIDQTLGYLSVYNLYYICDAYNEKKEVYINSGLNNQECNIIVSMRKEPSKEEKEKYGFDSFESIEMQNLSDSQMNSYIKDNNNGLYQLGKDGPNQIDKSLLYNTMVLILAKNSVATINAKVRNILHYIIEHQSSDIEKQIIDLLSENNVYGELICEDKSCFEIIKEMYGMEKTVIKKNLDKLSDSFYIKCNNMTDVIANYITMKDEDRHCLEIIMQKAFECVMMDTFEIEISKKEYQMLKNSAGKAYTVYKNDSGVFFIRYIHQNYRDVLCAMCYSEAIEYFNNENEKIDKEIEEEWASKGWGIEELAKIKEAIMSIEENGNRGYVQNMPYFNKYETLYNKVHLAKRKAIFKGVSKENIAMEDEEIESFIEKIEKNSLLAYEERTGENHPGSLRYVMNPMQISGEVMTCLCDLLGIDGKEMFEVKEKPSKKTSKKLNFLSSLFK